MTELYRKAIVTTMKIPFPVRINRYLALKGYATRRKADELIARGEVYLNGVRASVGDIVNENDLVEVRGRGPRKKLLYYAYHKPVDIVTHGAQNDEKDIQSMIGRNDVFPLGRLDKKSRGLILLTNDGRITGPLLNPDQHHEKEYRVKVDKRITNQFIKHMSRGVNIEGYITKPATVKKESEQLFTIILTEGKTHQIRRMCAALGYVVRDLERIRILNITLGTLKENQLRALKGAELHTFLATLRIDIV